MTTWDSDSLTKSTTYQSSWNPAAQHTELVQLMLQEFLKWFGFHDIDCTYIACTCPPMALKDNVLK